MSSADSIIAAEDRREGRSIPEWVYYLGTILPLLAYVLGLLDGLRDWPLWAGIVSLLGLNAAYALLFTRFKQRSAR